MQHAITARSLFYNTVLCVCDIERCEHDLYNSFFDEQMLAIEQVIIFCFFFFFHFLTFQLTLYVGLEQLNENQKIF